MSPYSRCALILAVALTSCEQSPVSPSSASSYGGGPIPLRLQAPSDLHASLVGLGKVVVVSWSYPSSYANATAGFLVERSLDPNGPWGIVRFTRETSIRDGRGSEPRYCYRVTAVTSSSKRDSPPSSALCIEPATMLIDTG